VQSLLCGKPLASTGYSSGEDFCKEPFVYTIGHTTYMEQGTNFIKATAKPEDVKAFIKKVWSCSRRDLEAWGEKGRIWAKKTFSIETIGAQWEALFDAMPIPDWDKINMTPAAKNDAFPFPQIDDEDKFIDMLYKEILKMDEPMHGEGFKNWKHQLKNGMSRQAVYDFFVNVARQENSKHQVVTQDFGALLDKTTGRKRALLLCRESAGDCLLITQLLESFHQSYPNHDLYLACDPKFRDVFVANPHIFKLLDYQPFMEQEMIMCGAGQTDPYFSVYLHPPIPTQRTLGYLFSETAAYTPHLNLT